MKTKRSIAKSILIGFLIAIFAFSNFYSYTYSALAISAGDIFNEFEERYHFNEIELRDAGEQYNVAGQKGDAPEVTFLFSPTDPKPGEKLTATANTLYFETPKEELYYTWYLEHNIPGCSLGQPGCGDDGRGNFNHNGDGDVDEEDWKIEAMRIVAAGDSYGWEGASRQYINENDPLNPANEFETISGYDDDDGYEASWGGHNHYVRNEWEDVGDEGRCYIHDFSDGINYEIVEEPQDDRTLCPPGHVAVCADNISTQEPNPIEGEAEGGSGSSSGGGGDASCSGGDCSVSGGSGSSSSTGGNVTIEGGSFLYSFQCRNNFRTPSCRGGEAYCGSGTPLCVNRPTASDEILRNCGVQEETNSLGFDCCGTWPEGWAMGPPACEERSYDDRVCEHLFPDTDEINEEVGDGDFDEDEERFWRTDPSDPDTDDDGTKDEADVVGLGQDQLTWTYTQGDRVGVVIEGLSMIPTKYDEASLMLMWAIPNNLCEPEERGMGSEEIKGYEVDIPTAAVNINEDCLEDGLVDPQDSGQPGKLEPVLTYSPEKPVNDPAGARGDLLTVHSSLKNSDQNNQFLHYQWRVQLQSAVGTGNTAPPISSWDNEPIVCGVDASGNQILGGCGQFGNPQIEGNNLADLELDLGVTQVSEPFYMRVLVKVEEGFSDIGYDIPLTGKRSRKGYGEVIIRVGDSDNNIIGAYRLDEDGNADAICDGVGAGDASDPFLCKVTRNEIIELHAPTPVNPGGVGNIGYQWNVNGQKLTCPSGVSNCTDGSNINYLPITGSTGQLYTVSVVSNNASTDESRQASRSFLVVNPVMRIDADGACRKFLGTYDAVGIGADFDDCSQTVFQAAGNFTVNVRFEPDYLDQAIVDGPNWTINGGLQTGTGMSFPVDTAPAGGYEVDTFQVEVDATYQQSDNNRQTLVQQWGFSTIDSSELAMSDSIVVEIVDSPSCGSCGSIAGVMNEKDKKSEKLLANLFSNIPSQFLFLFRITMTIIILIVTSGIIFSFFPEEYEDEKY